MHFPVPSLDKHDHLGIYNTNFLMQQNDQNFNNTTKDIQWLRTHDFTIWKTSRQSSICYIETYVG